MSPPSPRRRTPPLGSAGAPQRKLLVVSHPAAVAENQRVYARLKDDHGWETTLVVPHLWRHDYHAGNFVPLALPALQGSLRRVRVLFAGRPERHVYLAALRRLIRSIAPDVAFLEEETYVPVTAQWAWALSRAGVPFGVQADENLDRRLATPVRRSRRYVLETSAFVAARSPTAADMVRRWGGTLPTPLVPHAVPAWEVSRESTGAPFTVGFAGRLVEEKGLRDLLQAFRRLGDAARLLIVGDGPLRNLLAAEPGVEIRTGVAHDQMMRHYAEMDLVVLPSRTTEGWAEQFGRALVEGLYCGAAVAGSSSGEIPWVIGSTEGGWIFPEGDIDALFQVLSAARADPLACRAMAKRGRANAIRLFGEIAAARALDSALVTAAAPLAGAPHERA